MADSLTDRAAKRFTTGRVFASGPAATPLLKSDYPPPLVQVADALTDHAAKRYTTDNTSVIVVDLRTPSRRAAAAAGARGGGGWLGGLFGGPR